MATRKTAKELVRELDEALRAESAGTVEAVALRRDYWRQKAGEARELVRSTHKEIKAALAILQRLDKAYSAQRKTWIGPKVPPKNFQKPHRSADGE